MFTQLWLSYYIRNFTQIASLQVQFCSHVYIVLYFYEAKCRSSTTIVSKNHKGLKSDYLKPFLFCWQKNKEKRFY